MWCFHLYQPSYKRALILNALHLVSNKIHQVVLSNNLQEYQFSMFNHWMSLSKIHNPMVIQYHFLLNPCIKVIFLQWDSHDVNAIFKEFHLKNLHFTPKNPLENYESFVLYGKYYLLQAFNYKKYLTNVHH